MEHVKTTDWQNLSKKERQRLKKEQKRLERKRVVRKKNLVKFGLVLGLTTFLVGSYFLLKYINARRYKNAPRIQLTPKTYDFGKISASQGIVEASFEVKNRGFSTLTISGMETSCGCTTAKLKAGGKKSPEFAMHNNPTNWSASIEPREKAELIVAFDPNFHKNVYGPVTRTVSVFSNDPGKREEKVTIYANIEG